MDAFVNESIKNFNTLFSEQSFKVNKYETESEVIVKAILPGYKRSQIKLDIIGNVIRITVDDSTILEEENDQTMYHNKEQTSPKMERLVSLPFTISEENTKATYKDGILKITTPKKKLPTRNIDID